MLEIDAHTADAGLQTRLEAFLEIVHDYRRGRRRPASSFRPARLGRRGRLVRASGEELPLTDPRVKLHFPVFSPYHSKVWAMAARWLGLHPGPDLPLEHRQLERGLRHTSGRECLPLPICVGQMLQISDGRRPGEVNGLYMLRGGAPCVADCFMGYFERFIAQHELEDLFVFSPHGENDYCGFDPAELSRHFTPAVVVADLFVEIENALRVVGGPGALEGLARHWEDFVASATSLEAFEKQVPRLVDGLAAIPRLRAPADCPRAIVTGDFFTRFSGFFMEGVPDLYAERGIILKPVELNELVLYGLYDGIQGTAHRWGLEPGVRAAVKACTRILQPDGKEYLAQAWEYHRVRHAERTLRRQFERSGLLVAGPSDISEAFEEAQKHISPAIYGEAIPTIGRGLRVDDEGYAGVVLIGPFNCLPFRISEAILKPLCERRGIPLLSYESDGYAVAPSFLRQVDVHIQQVLDRWNRGREAPGPRPRLRRT
jgi:predicted nucleotide-binding protein (sugar kinase/HSP70/actin superfamily)